MKTDCKRRRKILGGKLSFRQYVLRNILKILIEYDFTKTGSSLYKSKKSKLNFHESSESCQSCCKTGRWASKKLCHSNRVENWWIFATCASFYETFSKFDHRDSNLWEKANTIMEKMKRKVQACI